MTPNPSADRPLTSFGLDFEAMVVPRLLERRAAEQPEGEFVVYGEESWTFGAVEAAAARIAGGLAGLGIAHGTRVGLFLPNCAEFVNAYFAAAKLGAPTVPINTAYRGYMLEYVLNDTACRFLIVDASYLDRIREALPKLESLECVIVRGELDGAPELEGVRTIALADVDGDPVATRPEVAFDDVSCIIYTSGTTGPSKGVPLTNGHSVAKAIEVIRLCEVTEDDCIYAPVPLFHSFALQRGVVTAVVSGCRCALRERFSASGYWDDVRRLGATVGFCVFTIPQILKKAPPSPSDRDHPLRCLYNARHDPEFAERFGIKLLEGYGLTEAGVAIYGRPGETTPPGSCGRVSEDWEVRLVDDRDRDVPQGEPGEIVIRPRYPALIMPGYLNKPEATVAAWRNLWFHTGDLATVDADGFYTFQDRKKDAIRRRGENVSSWEVEQVLREHDAVAEAAAVPYPSPLGEDDVRVVVTLNEGTQLTAEELLAFCTERLPEFMVPRYVEFRDELPRTPTGRVEKYRLREEGLGAGAHDRGDPREQRHATPAP
ncbi:MAG: carnitine-CoA ligase [Gaiellaceae bacterium]|jgi:crotonobetaine/carnitine-CoA ligase|nr:carnitine-CoA ligase [Gaiellaceae bacterium]